MGVMPVHPMEKRVDKARRRAQSIINTYSPGERMATIDPRELKWLCENALKWVRREYEMTEQKGLVFR